MKHTLFAALTAAPLMMTAVQADVAPETLQIYAAMAKIEANMAEAAGAVMLVVAAQGDADIMEEAPEDYASDLAQIDSFVAFLQSASLNEEQAAAVTALTEAWGPVAAAGTELLANDDDSLRATAFIWWESLDGLDDVVDDQLAAILEAAGAEILD